MSLESAPVDVGKPLIMVIEDREDLLSDEVQALESQGCTVMGFSSSDKALEGILSVPSVDLVVTDIDLDNSGHDKSGISVAKFIREIKMNTLVCGYSSKFADDGLTDDEKSLFDCWYPKGIGNFRSIIERRKDICGLANKHKSKKYEDITVKLESLRKRQHIKKEDFSQLRKMILSSDSPTDVERILTDANYSLRILHPADVNSFSNPVVIWIRGSDDMVEAEVYGHSSLYSYGSSEDEAVDKLIELMQLLEELGEEPDEDYQGDALKAKRFLDYVFVGRNE